jgi:hypothetical protein
VGKNKEHKTIILNGTTTWLGVIAFIIVHGGVSVFWAGRLDSKVTEGFSTVAAQIEMVNKKVDKLSDVVESNRKEAKDDLKDYKSRKH